MAERTGQQSIELRVLPLKPAQLEQPTQWRRNRLAELTQGKAQPKDPKELERLVHELAVLNQRAGVLRRDATAPDRATVQTRDAALRKELQAIDPKSKNPTDHFRRQGIEVRLGVLEERATTLPTMPQAVMTEPTPQPQRSVIKTITSLPGIRTIASRVHLPRRGR
ncbi:hypothetical protein HYS93_03680 [Candidatus Daviesbacteria bacterium]|nr:hypothetical protein [Candidatus Daviesbacteria bacterium]